MDRTTDDLDLPHALDGVVLTYRVEQSTHGYRDLWLGPAADPFLELARLGPLPLADGGRVQCVGADHVLVGPEGWLPDVLRGELLGLRWRRGALHVVPVEPECLAPPHTQELTRRALAQRVDSLRWYGATRKDRSRLLLRAIVEARRDDPGLLTAPHAPLDELLYDPLEHRPAHLWRDQAAARQGETRTLSVDSVPAALHRELDARALKYGMTLDQYVVAVLGHLAWRTPFAEDVEPFSAWTSERGERRLGVLHSLPRRTVT